MSSDLYQRIQEFYDQSSDLWEQIWGEHMHHGFYGWDGKARPERRQAQIDLIEELLRFAEVKHKQPETILDLGCGIGGSSLYLAKKFQSQVTGITLSPVQANRASQRARAAGLSDRVHFQVANALDLPFGQESFDLVWALESGEHMPNKRQFLQESYRVLKPQGQLILATWCHRATDQAPLTTEEIRHLKAIYEIYHLPGVISLAEYGAIVQDLGFQAIHLADWSQAVAPFWQAVIDSAWNWEAIVGLVRSGWQTLRSALALGLMRQGYERQLICFGVLVATKP